MAGRGVALGSRTMRCAVAWHSMDDRRTIL